ncbi:hypothetical protein BH09GEM1_BH09GEM1_08740 [soil metagenome]
MNGRSIYLALFSIALLAAWVGVAVFIATVMAPAAFAVLPTRTLAGALVGRALPVLFISGMVIGGAVAVLYSSSARAAAVGGVILLAGNASAQMIEWRLHTLLVALGAPIDSLAITDPRRIEFGRLHGVSVLLMAVGMLGAMAALVALMRRIQATTSAPHTFPSEHSDALSSRLASSPTRLIA